MPNTASSPVLEGVVSTQDAGSIRLLKEAGAIIVGKTQTHEFALGVTTPQSRNPWDPTRDPGGSSGGSAIAVATGMSLGAMATDTRASVRVPAALCGVVGYKPTFGLVPGDGVTMLSWSLDHVAHMAGTVEDVALLLNALAPAAPCRLHGHAQQGCARTAHWRPAGDAGRGRAGRGDDLSAGGRRRSKRPAPMS